MLLEKDRSGYELLRSGKSQLAEVNDNQALAKARALLTTGTPALPLRNFGLTRGHCANSAFAEILSFNTKCMIEPRSIVLPCNGRGQLD